MDREADDLAFAEAFVAKPEHVLRGPSRELVRDAVARLPAVAHAWLSARPAPIVFLFPIAIPGAVLHLADELPATTSVIALHPSVLRKPRAHGVALIVRELASVFARDRQATPDEVATELAADTTAHAWGVGADLLASYEAEVALVVTPSAREPYRRRIAALRTLVGGGEPVE